MKKAIILVTCLSLMLCQLASATAEITNAEQTYYHKQLDTLVNTIGDRNMEAPGQRVAMEYLIHEYKRLGCSFWNGTLRLCDVEGTDFWDYKFYSYDVIGIRKAQRLAPNIIVICAHFDSCGPGARDNASGVAGVLLFLRRFYQMEPYENTELRFVSFTAEETGHQGSDTYVRSLSPEERRRIIAVFNLDIIVVDEGAEDFCLSCDTLGGRTPDGYVQGQDATPVHNCASRAFAQAIADLQAFDPADNGITYVVPRHTGSSDHDSFHHKGIDAVNISFRGNPQTTGDWSELIHTPSDMIGDFVWDRTWQTLDILYTAIDGLAQDASYGCAVE